ncbi:MAG TPA: hypothetical protein VLA17_08380 [Candidatus Limnocylindria bacterium]|nr:hypothetical protein [Candidatus Limnocylindria bacterium]
MFRRTSSSWMPVMGPTVINPVVFARYASAYWQLALLGATSVALSIASGWTTWAGMKNFTDNPVLSLLITFGIQGVMLIAAWLIGETFARNDRVSVPDRRRGLEVSTVLRILLVALAILLLIGLAAEGIVLRTVRLALTWPWHTLALIALFAGVAWMLALRSRPERVRFHPGSLTASFKHASLWIMFLTCLTASVFFSFDSLFDTLFSPDDRKRASHTRVQSEVAGILTSLSNQLSGRRQSAIADLFASGSWADYDRGIAALKASVTEATATSRTRQAAAQRRDEEEAAVRLRAIAAAEGQLRSLEGRIALLREELSASGRAAETAGELAQNREHELTARRTELHVKVAEAEAEAAGAGVTRIAGHGPKFREIKLEETQLRIAESLAENLLDDARREQRRRVELRDALLAQITDLEARAGSQRNEIESAKRQLVALRPDLQTSPSEQSNERVNELNEARLAFLAAPTADGFHVLQQRCEALAATLSASENATTDGACDARAMATLTNGVFEATAKRDGLARECGSETRLDGLEADELLHVGQRCLQLASLQGEAAAAFQGRLRQVALRRDDRAHRFIVTWNAFFDRNQLAFVALFIAFAMDGLIFTSGLYGASARAELETASVKSVQQKKLTSETILDAALLPERQERARLLLEAIDFNNDQEKIVGEIDLATVEPARRPSLRAVLNAAMVIGLARPRADGRFAIHPNLIEMLTCRTDRIPGPGSDAASDTVPSELLRLSLGKDGTDAIRLLLRAARALPSGQEFTHQIDVGQQMSEQLLTVLNAGVASACISTEAAAPDRYLLRPSFFRVLAHIVSAETAAETEVLTTSSRIASVGPTTALEKPRKLRSENDAPVPGGVAASQSTDPEPCHAQALANATLPIQDGDGLESLRRDEEMASTSIYLPESIDGSGSTFNDGYSLLRPGNLCAQPADHPAVNTISIQRRGAPATISRHASQTIIALSAELADQKIARSAGDRPVSNLWQRTEYDADDPCLSEHLLVALSRATGLSKVELGQLVDPRATFAFSGACKSLQSLREGHAKLDHTLRNLEREIWTRIHEFARSGSRASIGPAADTLSGAERQLIAKCFPRILLRWRGLREAQSWCEDFVAEHEIFAGTAGIPEANAERLRRVARSLPALMEVDEQDKSAWEDLICRINGLCDTRAGDPAIEGLMP